MSGAGAWELDWVFLEDVAAAADVAGCCSDCSRLDKYS